MLGPDGAPYRLLSPEDAGARGGFAQAGAGGPSSNSAGLPFAKKNRAGAARVWRWEVAMRRGGTGSTPELRERLQEEINASIRPTAPFQPGGHPHARAEPPRGPVRPGVNPSLLSLDKPASRGVSACG